jgi:branched-chain amino acid transport system permease protein
MLILGGSGSNLGALLVWGQWSGSGALLHELLPATLQVRGAALQIVLIGIVPAAVLLLRPRGLIGEKRVVSRHLGR